MTTKQRKSMQLKRLSSCSKGVIMRITLTIAILTLGCVQLSATLFGQRVTLNLRDASFLETIRCIEKQSGYSFIYKMVDISVLGPVTISVTDRPVIEVLHKLLDNKIYSFHIQEQVIALTKKPTKATTPTAGPPARSPQTVIQQEIHGRVTDSLGNPLEGVSVLVKGAERRTVTNAN